MINMKKLQLSKKIYLRKYIEKAILNYNGLAKIKYEESKGYYILTFEDCYYDIEQTLKEYENHVIDLTVSIHGK